jgi:hypothetical protein
VEGADRVYQQWVVVAGHRRHDGRADGEFGGVAVRAGQFDRAGAGGIATRRICDFGQVGTSAISIATVAAGWVAAVVAGSGKLLAKRTAPVVECTLLSVGAGVMYGLQDAATRGVIVFVKHHSLLALVPTMWPWVLLASATAGVLLTQAAFRAERLDWALPPTAAAQPIAGIVIGVTLLSDHLSASGVPLVFEALCLVAMLGGVLLIGQSPAFEN